MADATAIQWADATWSPVTGCSKVSPGCAHCYAERLATTKLKGTKGYPGLPWAPENAERNVVLHPERLDQPDRWRKPRMIFVCSMADLFHELVPDEFIVAVWNVMARNPRHTFQILTKRPERMRDLLLRWSDYGDGTMDAPEPNVWLGTSIENRRFVGRADVLREVPAAVRFISAEPLLGPLLPNGGPVDYDHAPEPLITHWPDGVNVLDVEALDLTDIDWLIVGGESGPDARPIRESWVRDLQGAARDAGTAFFLKQWSGRLPGRLDGAPADLVLRDMPLAHA